MSRGGAALALAALALAAVLFMVLRDDDDDEGPATNSSTPAELQQPSRPQIPTIVVRDGQPQGGVEEIEVERGDTVTVRVRSDLEGDVHFHDPYEEQTETEVVPGRAEVIEFVASADGIYEMEFHGHDESGAELSAPLAELTVNP
jgi:hypothetical protein